MVSYSLSQPPASHRPPIPNLSLNQHVTFTSYFTSFPFQKPILSFLPPSNFFLPQLSFYNSNSCAVSAIWIVGTISTRKCGLGEWWSLDSSLKVEDYFGAVKSRIMIRGFPKR
ncbi:hypothetical protein Prudu_004663 [Prunus dulcis]|uniref:Uncharacterized protein n=1 Tax=Prunus dulcis TaxID=3755 RepID=A0A4Y1QVV1_PRUDU|nr:hypothetical protein Prudu_004663 [Prunus dulcis]